MPLFGLQMQNSTDIHDLEAGESVPRRSLQHRVLIESVAAKK